VLRTYAALQLNDLVEKLKSTELTGESQRTQLAGITSLDVRFLPRVLHGVGKHRLHNHTTNKTEWTTTSGTMYIHQPTPSFFNLLTLERP